MELRLSGVNPSQCFMASPGCVNISPTLKNKSLWNFSKGVLDFLVVMIRNIVLFSLNHWLDVKQGNVYILSACWWWCPGPVRSHLFGFLVSLYKVQHLFCGALDCYTLPAWWQWNCQWGMTHSLQLAGIRFFVTVWSKYRLGLPFAAAS